MQDTTNTPDWHHVNLSRTDPLFDKYAALQDRPPVGVTAGTIAQNVKKLRSIRRQFGGAPLLEIISTSAAGVPRLEENAAKHDRSLNTLATEIGALLSAVKHAMGDRAKLHTEHYMRAWQAGHGRIQAAAQAAFSCNRASTQKQRDGFVSYAELCACRDRLPLGDPLRLWLALATLIPCQRAGDYGVCKLFFASPSAEELTAHAGNYMVLTATGQPFLHMRVFKTAKSYPGGIKLALPPRLCAEIAHSLAGHRSYLFVQEKSPAGEPYLIRGSFTRWLQRGLKKVLGNPHVTPQLVRRAYVTEAHARLRQGLESPDPATRALARERQAALAHCCAHSKLTHNKYKFDLDDGDRPVMLQVEATAPLSAAAACEPIACAFDGM